jgi:hypothetical protein
MTSAKGKNGLSVQIQANLQNGGSYVITRVLDRPEGTRLRLRLLQPAGGVNFHEFLLRESSDGLRAVDLRIAATGEDMSETFRRLEVLSQAQQSRSFLDRLSGKDVAFVKHWSQMRPCRSPQPCRWKFVMRSFACCRNWLRPSREAAPMRWWR